MFRRQLMRSLLVVATAIVVPVAGLRAQEPADSTAGQRAAIGALIDSASAALDALKAVERLIRAEEDHAPAGTSTSSFADYPPVCVPETLLDGTESCAWTYSGGGSGFEYPASSRRLSALKSQRDGLEGRIGELLSAIRHANYDGEPKAWKKTMIECATEYRDIAITCLKRAEQDHPQSQPSPGWVEQLRGSIDRASAVADTVAMVWAGVDPVIDSGGGTRNPTSATYHDVVNECIAASGDPDFVSVPFCIGRDHDALDGASSASSESFDVDQLRRLYQLHTRWLATMDGIRALPFPADADAPRREIIACTRKGKPFDAVRCLKETWNRRIAQESESGS